MIVSDMLVAKNAHYVRCYFQTGAVEMPWRPNSPQNALGCNPGCASSTNPLLPVVREAALPLMADMGCFSGGPGWLGQWQDPSAMIWEPLNY